LKLGIKNPGRGTGMDMFSFTRYLTISFFTGVSSGASLSFQSGISSLRAVGSNTLPDKI
jgi:hypothetical protein